MNIKFVIICFLFIHSAYSQISNNENLAIEYYRQGEFEKAVKLFENVYKKKKVKAVYLKYVNCLINTQDYKKAEKIIKNFYKKTEDPTVLVDLGALYALQGNEKLANEKFETAIKEAKYNNRILASLAHKLLKEKFYTPALEAYQLAKQKSNIASYSIQIANIHSYLGDIEKMYEELVTLVYTHPNYFQTCKNKLRITISDDYENANNKKLKKILIKNIQKENSYEVSKMLVWLLMQEKRFQEALDYEITIDKRISDNISDIINLGNISSENEDYETAINCFEYVLERSPEYSYWEEYSRLKILDIQFQNIQDNKIPNASQVKRIASLYKEALDDLGIKSETIDALKNYCNILLIYLDEPFRAINLLRNSIENTTLDKYDLAVCKMELASALLAQGEVWDATLIYAQVEKEFKEDVIGQKAKFQKTKISYYNGDFEWAQTQLKVLKLSTSKLIANNAMKLSLLISDNLNLDTTDTALLIYAQSELLFKQKKYTACLKKLNELEAGFPGHSLLDEVLLKKSDVYIALNEYFDAIDCLKQIGEKYYYDILYDDALFYQAQIYENALDDKKNAKAKYEEFSIKLSSSFSWPISLIALYSVTLFSFASPINELNSSSA